MAIIYADDSGPIIWPSEASHDPESRIFYYLDYRPPVRSPGKEYVKGLDVVVPQISNGCMYECVSGGITALDTPNFDTTEGKFVNDGTVKWKVLAMRSKLLVGDVITSSTWTGTDGVTLSNGAVLNGVSTAIRVDTVPIGAKKFTITNHTIILRSSGRIEELERSIIIPIVQL